MLKLVTEKTAIPIGLAVIAIGGGAAWLTSRDAQIQSSMAAISEIKTKQDRYSEDIGAIRTDIALIKQKFGIK